MHFQIRYHLPGTPVSFNFRREFFISPLFHRVFVSTSCFGNCRSQVFSFPFPLISLICSGHIESTPISAKYSHSVRCKSLFIDSSEILNHVNFHSVYRSVEFFTEALRCFFRITSLWVLMKSIFIISDISIIFNNLHKNKTLFSENRSFVPGYFDMHLKRLPSKQQKLFERQSFSRPCRLNWSEQMSC